MEIDFTMSKREDIIFSTAKEAVARLTKKYEGERDLVVEQNIWKDVVENHRRSPKVMALGDPIDEKYMIFCPKHCSQFQFLADGYDCHIEVIDGSFVDKITGKRYSKGDRFVLDRLSKMSPITLSCEAYIKVERIK